MTLELGQVIVSNVEITGRTAIVDGRLALDADALADDLRQHVDGVAAAIVHLVHPGESARVVCVKDLVQPRVKVTGGQIVGFQEGVLDASGPGADHTPVAGHHLVVLEIDPRDGLTPHEHERALREAGLRTARAIGAAAAAAEPASWERFELAAVEPGSALPRIAYVCMLLSQGLLHDTWVLGEDAKGLTPHAVDPAALLDTTVVSGNCVSACDKNTTFHHQNNPIVRELFRRHGVDLRLVGAVLTNAPTRLAQKETSAAAAIDCALSLEPDGVVISKEGFGNPDADLMMLIRGLEQRGVRTVALTDEFAGADGASPSLADTTPEADAIVSTGNANERIVLPPMKRVIGPIAQVPRLAGADAACVRPDGSLEVELQLVTGATNAKTIRAWHLLNQFFAGIGGEEEANLPPRLEPGARGPGRLLESLAPELVVTTTIVVGDNYAAERLDAVTDEVIALLEDAGVERPDVLIAGPAFLAGRYGLACATIATAIQERLGVPAVTGMHPDNPGAASCRATVAVVKTGRDAMGMADAAQTMVAVARKLVAGETLQSDVDGTMTAGRRRNVLVEQTGAERAVDMLLAKLRGEPVVTEYAMPVFDRVRPAPPVEDLAHATVALVTSGGIVPRGNPDRIESASASKFGEYDLAGLERLSPQSHQTAHGGYDPTYANADPNRVLPLDAARELEREGRIGRLHDRYYATVGNATSVENAKRFGREIARRLVDHGVDAVVLTST
jgi:glycine reductase